MEAILNAILNNLIPLIAILLTSGIVITFWRSRRRYNLLWAYSEPKSMLDIAEQVATSLMIYYNDQQINNLTQYLFILHNTGFAPLDKKAIVEPVTWQAPGKIFSARVVETDPPVELILDYSDQQLQVSWLLFNQRCKALIEVLCEGDANAEVSQVRAQITSVPIIKQKKARGVSEEETPNYISIISLISLCAWIGIHSVASEWPDMLSVALDIPAIEGSEILRLFFSLLLSVFVGWVSFLLFFRNPYAKLLQSIKNQSGSA